MAVQQLQRLAHTFVFEPLRRRDELAGRKAKLGVVPTRIFPLPRPLGVQLKTHPNGGRQVHLFGDTQDALEF